MKSVFVSTVSSVMLLFGGMCAAQSVEVYLAGEDTDRVIFNMTSKKYHKPSCNTVKRCTNCVELSRKEAKERGGVPCKVCGAGE